MPEQKKTNAYVFWLVVWAVCLTTVVSIKIFFAPEDMSMATATAYATFMAGPIGLAIKLFKVSRGLGE